MIKLCLYDKIYDKKPTDKEAGAISKRIHRNCRELELEEFANIAGNSLCAFTPAVFNGERNAENVREIQLLCLDFDNDGDKKISFDEVRRRSEILDLPIAFAYETFSSSDCSRFRVIYRYFEPIVKKEFYKLLYMILLKFFPEADKHTSDICRMFYGGKRLITGVSYDVIYPQRLFSSLYQHFDTNPKETIKKIKKFADTADIDIVKNTFKVNIVERDEIGKIKEPILYNNINNEEIFVIYRKNYRPVQTGADKRRIIKNISFGDISNGCKLINDFETGERWLYYDEMWGILTNMVHISGGIKYFSEIMEKLHRDCTHPYKYEKWKSNVKQIKKCPYMPERCEMFCPYHEECNHAKNIITTIKPARFGVTVKNKNKRYVSIEEAREDLYTKIYSAINSNDNDIHIIEAQTGIGKTEGYIQAIRESDKKFIIAAPTNDLKNEIYNRMRNAGVDAVITPELPEDIDEKDKEKLESMYHKGNLAGYNKVLNELEHRYKSVKVFKKDLRVSKKYEGNIVTTHARLMYLFDEDILSTHTIIVDEDIFDSIFNTDTVTQGEIKYLLNQNYLRKEIKQRIKYFSKTTENHINKYKKHNRKFEPYIKLNDDELNAISDDDNIKIDVEKFINAEGTIADNHEVCYAWTRDLPAQKIILLSATVNKGVYERFFENKNRHIKYIKIKEVRYKGKVIQECYNSYSRKWMKNNEDTVNEIRERHKDCVEITFKSNKNLNSNIYFGITEGKNGMSGKDILVLGTPFYNEKVYKLLAACLNCDMKAVNEASLNHCLVENDDNSYYFFTYTDEFLRNIQIYFISSELEQSVGRARLLNNDCTVYVYSSCPVKQAEFIKEEPGQCNDTAGEETSANSNTEPKED